eukprot:TRINITY_DN526_c0_g1_i1.p1 TRINITY_DN526_c0_g1~~TRINITY_DN526_c0_g1_i1.p1  ORF type:complete len:257 (-),score=39.21 TRINITY_DN526_c0_g1_i1:269-1039(-)
MNTIVSATLLFLAATVAGRDLKSLFAVVGNGNNLGSAFTQTEATVPNTPGYFGSVFDTILETNFTTGAGRFLGLRDTYAQTAGPGLQLSGGASNISSVLGTANFTTTVGQSITGAQSVTSGANGTFGATFTNTTNDVLSFTSTTLPQGTFVDNSFTTGAIRSGLGSVASQGNSLAASGLADYADSTLTQSNSVGAAQAGINGIDTLSFANGNAFSVSGSEETVTGCEQEAGAAAYGGGYGGSAVTACSSRGSFVGV